MKKRYFGMIYAMLLINVVPVAAMQPQAYPWYQAYKRPEVQEQVSRGLQRTKEFVQRHKGKLLTAAVVAAILAGAGAGYIKFRSNIIKIYDNYLPDDMEDIKEDDKKDYDQLINAGAWFYGQQYHPEAHRRRILDAFLASSEVRQLKNLYGEDNLRAAWETMLNLRK